MDFQERRINDLEKIIELSDLSAEKNFLNEQIFFMDLQNKTLVSQYKKVLMKIGTAVETMKSKKKKQSLPFVEEPPINQYLEMINNAKNEINKIKQQINDDNNKLFEINLNYSLFEKTKLIEHSDFDNKENEIIDINVIIKKRYELGYQKKRLLKICEYNWRNLKFMNELEIEMLKQLRYLIDVSKGFIREGKWYPGEKNIKFESKNSFFNESFSIP